MSKSAIERQMYDYFGERIRKSLDKYSKDIGAGRCLTSSLVANRLLKEKGVETKVVYGDFEGNSHTWIELQKDGETYILDYTASDFNVAEGEIVKIRQSKWFTEDYRQKVTVKQLPNVVFAKKSDLVRQFPNGWVKEGELSENRIEELIFETDTKKVLKDVSSKSDFQKHFEFWENNIKNSSPQEVNYV